jgi:hypothetical protein
MKPLIPVSREFYRSAKRSQMAIFKKMLTSDHSTKFLFLKLYFGRNRDFRIHLLLCRGVHSWLCFQQSGLRAG